VPLGAVVQIIPDRLPKVEKAKPRQEMSGGVVAANVTPQPPPKITATTAANVTPQPPPKISATTLATPPSSALTVAGALAGARQKAKLATNKRL
jgi:hypothetical protein